MERLGRSVQLGSAGSLLATILSAGSVHAQAPAPSPGSDTSNPAEIVAAREMFRQGTEDADAGRFADGLEKFKRVAAVKETAAVRFNIARCEEALGKTGGALADFELAAREGREDPKSQDVAKLAAERADALRPRVPRLTLTPPPKPPEGMLVSLDGSKLATATLGVGLPVDPGPHTVDAAAPGRSPFHSELSLAPGESKSVAVTLPAAAKDAAAGSIEDSKNTAPAPSAGERGGDGGTAAQRTWGWVTLALGGALGAASAVFLVLHNNAVSNTEAQLLSECTEGNGKLSCASSGTTEKQVQTQYDNGKSEANTDQNVAITLVAASGVAIVGGLLLVFTAPRGPHRADSGAAVASPAPRVEITSSAPGALAGFSIQGSF